MKTKNYIREFLEKSGMKPPKDGATALPISVVIRNIVGEDFAKRYGVKEGIDLQNTVIEFYMKNEMITQTAITALGMATEKELVKIIQTSFKVNMLLTPLFRHVNLNLVDVKLGFSRAGKDIVLVDEVEVNLLNVEDGEKLKGTCQEVAKRLEKALT